jgi:hypothetical protein
MAEKIRTFFHLRELKRKQFRPRLIIIFYCQSLNDDGNTQNRVIMSNLIANYMFTQC